MLASKLGLELRIATPVGYECQQSIVDEALSFAKISGAKIAFYNDPKIAVEGVDVVITDTWISMGQESEKETKLKAFDGYMVDSSMMNIAKPSAVFMHCLPAYRGYEVSEEVFEAHSQTIFLEAENRLHTQKGIMVWLDNHRND
jgi:ornithine carbamoyltransferase